jgi:hypothetical protein
MSSDEEPISAEPAPPERPQDPEAPERDALEQTAEVSPGWRVGPMDRGLEVPESDAIDQAMEIPDPDDER